MESCRKLICVVRSKQQHHVSSSSKSRKETGWDSVCGCEGQVKAGDELRLRDHWESNLSILLCSARERGQPSISLTCQGSTDRPVPLQIISNLRRKTLEEGDGAGQQTLLCDSFEPCGWHYDVKRCISPLTRVLSWVGRLQRWSSMIPLSAACVSRNRLLWPWEVLSPERRHNCSARDWWED